MPESLEEMLPCAGCDGTDQNVDRFPVLGHNNALYHNMNIDGLAAYVCTRYAVRSALSPRLGEGEKSWDLAIQAEKDGHPNNEPDWKRTLKAANIVGKQAYAEIGRLKVDETFANGKLEGRKEALEAVRGCHTAEFGTENEDVRREDYNEGVSECEQAILALPEAK